MDKKKAKKSLTELSLSVTSLTTEEITQVTGGLRRESRRKSLETRQERELKTRS
ncbi:hypothetical protein [Bernardetia sp.]|uniref:hypothetical protein n=1 Tax=Bernardetia sp. TaxID=1937974 RepID=UPI0025BB167B|nr:hypothetical protein [Bernardetia sp.]